MADIVGLELSPEAAADSCGTCGLRQPFQRDAIYCIIPLMVALPCVLMTGNFAAAQDQGWTLPDKAIEQSLLRSSMRSTKISVNSVTSLKMRQIWYSV